MITQAGRAQNVFTAAAIALVLFMSMLSQTWVIAFAVALAVVGLILFPETRRIGVVALASSLVVATVIAVFLAMGR